MLSIGLCAAIVAYRPQTALADAPAGLCGNIAVHLTGPGSVQLCPGGPVVTVDGPEVVTSPATAEVSPDSLVFEQCTWTADISAATTNDDFPLTFAQYYYLGGFSEIEQYENPPGVSLTVTGAQSFVGYSDGGTGGSQTSPSAFYSGGAIAQIEMHGVQRLNWAPPPATGLGLVVYTMTGDVTINSPGFSNQWCDPLTVIITESDPVTTVIGGICGFLCNISFGHQCIFGVCF